MDSICDFQSHRICKAWFLISYQFLILTFVKVLCNFNCGRPSYMYMYVCMYLYKMHRHTYVHYVTVSSLQCYMRSSDLCLLHSDVVCLMYFSCTYSTLELFYKYTSLEVLKIEFVLHTLVHIRIWTNLWSVGVANNVAFATSIFSVSWLQIVLMLNASKNNHQYWWSVQYDVHVMRTMSKCIHS